MNYLLTVRAVFFLTISLNIALYFFGYLRASVLYDYFAFWPITLLPLVVYYLIYKSQIRNSVKSATLSVSIISYILFPILHLFIQPSFLPTYSIESKINRINEIRDFELNLTVDTRGAIEVSATEGTGYLLDIINLPGTIGFPEAIEVENVIPKILFIRELDVDTLLKTKGWDLRIGDSNLWNLDIFSIDARINLENVNLKTANISGTGEIYLDKDDSFDSFVVGGNFTIFVPKGLPLLVEGNAIVPNGWLEVTIGYLSQTNQSYNVKIVVLNDSEVRFEDY